MIPVASTAQSFLHPSEPQDLSHAIQLACILRLPQFPDLTLNATCGHKHFDMSYSDSDGAWTISRSKVPASVSPMPDDVGRNKFENSGKHL